jgi:Astacin (Peptidase family M12A)
VTIKLQLNQLSDAYNMDTIERALIEYHSKTCIRFVPRRASDRDYISIESGSSGCWSSVGRIGGKQVVNLQTPGCVSKIGTVIHELLHVLGFLHEQNREERDGFVIIKKNNIKSGYEINFAKAKAGETTGFCVNYDYGSVMHYSPTAFSKNGQPTIEAKSKSSGKMGQRDGFSKKDIEKVNKMYKCQQTSTIASTTVKPTTKPTTKPPASESSGLGSLIEIFFPSSMDEEEKAEKKMLGLAL